MSGFSDWFDRESGYALHRFSGKKVLKDCCGLQPRPTDRAIVEFFPKKGEIRLPLYRCETCGAFLIAWDDQWYKLENLLKYRVVKCDEDRGS